MRTFNLSISAREITGAPLPCGTATFELTYPDVVADEIVVPKSNTVVLDSNGQGTLRLWPNGDGAGGTQYHVWLRSADGALQCRRLVTMPANDTVLHALIDTGPPPTIDAATVAKLAAQASAAAAGTSEANASGSAGSAATSATNCATSAANAAGSATAASTSAGTASTKAGEAATSAGNAAGSASAASASASNASTSAATATTQATNAATSATAAAASATAASNALLPANFGPAMLAWFNTLPTALPASAGVLWNNGGTLAQS